MPQNANIVLNLEGLLQIATALGFADYKLARSYVNRLAEGIGAAQIDRWYHAQRTISASATDSLDFSGSLLDPLSATAVMARMKVLIVSAAVGNTNNVNVVRPASNGVPWALAAGDGVAVAPGESKVLINRVDATGVLVTAGTGDLIDFINSGAGTPVTYDVLALGCSA